MEHTRVISLNGWNTYARRFVDAPTWTWDEVPEAASYVVRLAAEGDETANVHRVSRPSLDMSGIWGRLPYGRIDMLIEGHDTEGRETCVS